jgi:hypothetical protein
MFEHKSKPLLPRKAFYARFAWSVAATAGIVVFSLFWAVPVSSVS